VVSGIDAPNAPAVVIPARRQMGLPDRIVTTYTAIKADVAQKIKLPAWPQEINVDSLKAVADLMHRYAITKDTVDVTEPLATSSRRRTGEAS
jgi:hypothetical protein